MFFLKQRRIGLYFTLAIIFLFALIIQNKFLFNSDVSWLLFVTKRFLAGGTYSQDFFEINPPMILYLYVPVILVAKILPVSLFVALRIYVFILVGLSLLLSGKFLHKTVDDKNIFSLMLATIAGILLILPLGDFGQREHLSVILIMPYLLLMLCRLQKLTCQTSYAIFTGMLAGAGFAIKPYFLLTVVLLELFYLIKSHNFLGWMRAETFAIFAIMLLYAAALLTLHIDYINLILPSITQYYYQDVSASLSAVVFNQFAFFYYFSIGLFWARYKNNQYKNLSSVLLLAEAGFFLAFLMQKTIWYYHIYPMFAFGILLDTVLLATLIKQEVVTRIEYIKLLLFFALLGAYTIIYIPYVWIMIMYSPIAYFAMFAFIFIMILSGVKNNVIKSIALTLVALGINFLFYQNIKHSYFHYHIFFFSVLLFTLFYILYIARESMQSIIRLLVVYSLSLLIFIFPFFEIGSMYNELTTYNKMLSPFIKLMSGYPKKSVYFFTDSGEFAFPAVQYTNQEYTSRFGCFTWLPLFQNTQNLSEYKTLYFEKKDMMDFYINDVVADIQKYKPDMIFVDSRGKGYIGIIQPDYVRFFQQNTAFHNAWAGYRYLKTVSGKPLYKFDIYVKQTGFFG